MLQGTRRKVLHINSTSWGNTLSGSAPSVPTAPNSGDSCLTEVHDGTQIGTQDEAQNTEVRQESVPIHGASVPGDRGSGAHGALGTQNKLDDLSSEKLKASRSIHWKEAL